MINFGKKKIGVMLNIAKNFQVLNVWQKTHAFALGVSTESYVQQKAKIDHAKKLFNKISDSGVKYHDVDSYQSLLEIMEML
jgi:hypothetical protein